MDNSIIFEGSVILASNGGDYKRVFMKFRVLAKVKNSTVYPNADSYVIVNVDTNSVDLINVIDLAGCKIVS